MSSRRIIFIIFVIIFINHSFLFAGETKEGTEQQAENKRYKEKEERLPPRLVSRLSIIPGMGQFYNNKKTKAWTIIGLEVGAITGTLVLHNVQQKAYRDWEVIPESDTKKRKDYRDRLELYRTSRNTLIWFGGLLWIYNMIDAYVDAHFYQFDERKREEQKESSFYLKRDLEDSKKIILGWEKYF